MKKEQKQKLDNISRTQGYYNWEHMKVNDVETIEDAMLLGFEIGQQVKSVDLDDVVCWADMTEETPNLGDLILVRFPPEQRTRPVIIEFDELFEWIDGTQYIRL